ncbi:MAG: hypothetical protein IJ368_03120 [Oscillospiraceae bacterium]|nr:hypothetical protein [Oscillospiraceae bacterium]
MYAELIEGINYTITLDYNGFIDIVMSCADELGICFFFLIGVKIGMTLLRQAAE